MRIGRKTDVLMDKKFMQGVYQTLIKLDEAYMTYHSELRSKGHLLELRANALAHKKMAQLSMLRSDITEQIIKLKREREA